MVCALRALPFANGGHARPRGGRGPLVRLSARDRRGERQDTGDAHHGEARGIAGKTAKASDTGHALNHGDLLCRSGTGASDGDAPCRARARHGGTNAAGGRRFPRRLHRARCVAFERMFSRAIIGSRLRSTPGDRSQPQERRFGWKRGTFAVSRGLVRIAAGAVSAFLLAALLPISADSATPERRYRHQDWTIRAFENVWTRRFEGIAVSTAFPEAKGGVRARF